MVMTFKAHVHDGRLLLDEAIAESDEDIKAGRLYAADQVLAELRLRQR